MDKKIKDLTVAKLAKYKLEEVKDLIGDYIIEAMVQASTPFNGQEIVSEEDLDELKEIDILAVNEILPTLARIQNTINKRLLELNK